MDLIEVQISEIKNLDLIYVFSTDSIFKNETNKYVGAKIVYDKNRVLALDYKNRHFEKFIKRILDRYKREKGRRKIILLGDLTKKLVNDASFAVLDEERVKGKQESGLPSFNTNDREIKNCENYLKETMQMIIMLFKKYEVLKIDQITGFNHKYVVDYSIGSVKKQLPIILFQGDDGSISFKVKVIDDVPIDGKIECDGGKVNISWADANDDLKGSIIYDAQDKAVERKITSNGVSVFYDETVETLLEEDIDLLKFYFDFCEIEMPSNILKTSDKSFLLSDEKTISEGEEEILYTNTGSQVDISNDKVVIRHRLKNGFTKYNNQINVTLDQESEEITLKVLEIETKKCILMERKKSDGHNTNFTYHIYEVDEELDLTKPFNVQNKIDINREVPTLEVVKEYIKSKRKGAR